MTHGDNVLRAFDLEYWLEPCSLVTFTPYREKNFYAERARQGYRSVMQCVDEKTDVTWAILWTRKAR